MDCFYLATTRMNLLLMVNASVQLFAQWDAALGAERFVPLQRVKHPVRQIVRVAVLALVAHSCVASSADKYPEN